MPFLFVILLLPTAAAISQECQNYLMGVAFTNSQFQVCALIRARPFSVCTMCHRDFASAYNTFIELKDGRGPIEKNCSEDLVSGDRISIINRDFRHLTSTWEDANCDSCLVMNKTKDVVSFKVSESTHKFRRLSALVDECIDSQLQNKSLICDVCSEHFRNLSSFYDSLNEKSAGNMCMDILDTMNQTRVEWSTFGCSKVYPLDIEVWIYAAMMVVLTLTFYLVARFSQNPKDEAIIEGRTLKDRMSKIFQDDGSNLSVNSQDSLRVVTGEVRQ
ncbi:osteopetrosis-associated transmembrane protein 1 [Galendromus occidentalis]|uniref:Osteopetrosis-associated transmembrane protein 1 n=1 Tax=Galendromus occidentalis TaxID=34638 RepID=A0AAJ6QNL4_9ACAR|nr:osteopetrosis-associated transmembrane protein 1 [Galendromus occidentalis]